MPGHLRGRPQRRRRPGHEPPPPLRHRQGPLLLLPQGQHRAVRQEGDRRAGRGEFRRSDLRRLRAGRRRRDVRRAHRQPQPHGRRAAQGVRGLRREPRRDGLRELPLRVQGPVPRRGQARLRGSPDGSRPRSRGRRRQTRRRLLRGHLRPQDLRARPQGARGRQDRHRER